MEIYVGNHLESINGFSVSLCKSQDDISLYADECFEFETKNRNLKPSCESSSQSLVNSMHLGDRLIVNENYIKMAQNMMNLKPGMNSSDTRWAEMNMSSDQEKLRTDKRSQGPKMKDDHSFNYQRTHSPNQGLKTNYDPRDIRNPNDRGARREEMVSNLDYFMHSGYPYPNFNLHARRDSPPDLIAAERTKQAFARANEGFLPGASRSMPPDLSKFTPEQREALFKTQNMGISVTISPPELTERSNMLPPGNRAGLPNQRPSPQSELQHRAEFAGNVPFMGMEEQLLRIAESNNMQNAARADINAVNAAAMYAGMARMPPSSQVQNFQNLNIHQQNSLRFNSEMVRQAAGFPFGMDPRLIEHNRVFSLSAARGEHPSPGEANSQSLPDNSDLSQKKNLHAPQRPMALGPNFVPQSHLPLNAAQGTPSSDDVGSASSAGSSTYADLGTPSPKSEDHARMGTKQKAKSRAEGSNQCSQCGKGFSSSSALAKHKLIHSDERRYVCQICSKGFKRQDHLNGHMITHRDKKPYECHFSECDKSYSDMRSLKRHLENHHGVPPVSSSSIAHQSSASHSSQQSSGASSSNSLHPSGVEDRNNNMKGVAPPERPSSAPSGNPEVRTRSRIRSNSCEDIPSLQSDREVNNDKGTKRDIANDQNSDEIFQGSTLKKTDTDSSSKESQENSHKHEENPGNQVKVKKEPNMASPLNPTLQQWTGNQFAGPNFQGAWNSAQAHWNNAQLVASMGMAQGRGNLPFLMGARQPLQQFYQAGYFPGGPNDPGFQMEPANKKSKPDLITSSQNAFAQNALQMFASMAAQRTPMPTDILLHQGAMGCYTDASAPNKPTNAAAIAIAAAKSGSMFCGPPQQDMRLYGAHPGAAQWQDVVKEENVGSERDAPQKSSKMAEENGPNHRKTEGKQTNANENSLGKDNNIKQKEEKSPNKVSVLAVNVHSVQTEASPAVSPRRKQRPHPGPIIIPASVNNKVTHSVTFTGSTMKSVSPVRMDYPKAPIYTPPPMLSPRSIFFTGNTCGTPRSAIPLTPGRLLLSARRLSTTEGVKEEESEPQVQFPEPKINVGPQFQALVSKRLEPHENAQKDEHRATLMWAPLKEDKNKRKEVENYLEMACSSALFGGSSNKEYASHILHRTRGSIKEAVRLLLSRRHILRADDPNADYHYTGSVRWTAKERLRFREAYRTKGKNFHLIQKEVGTKSVKQCIEFYYLWKATNPEGFRARTRYVELESEQEEEEIATPSVFETPLSTVSKDAIFHCDYPECQARFVSRQALNGHIRVHGGSFGKPIEVRKPRPKPAVIITSSSVSRDSSRDSSVTPQKRKKSPSPSLQSNTDAQSGVPLQFACKVCGRVFSKVKSRSAHMKTHVPKKPDEHKNINTMALLANA